MSHFTKLDKANITNKDAFIAACKELGLTDIETNAKITAWDRSSQTVDVAVRAKTGYDIGLKKGEGKRWDLISDWSMMHLPETLKKQVGGYGRGQDLANRLVQLTTKHTVIADFRRQGFVARVTEDEKRNLHVTLTR